jgi:uncharacterized protein YicC (UPF0701 family)
MEKKKKNISEKAGKTITEKEFKETIDNYGKSEDRMPEINEIKQQENKNLAQMCLGNLEQIEKSVMEIEKMIKEFQKIELKQTRSYIETQKELLKYFVR